MLPATRRVRRREEFTATVRDGRRAASAGLVAHVRTSAGGDQCARAGFVVGRAVGPAVVRNRLRRQLRHLIAPRLASLPDGTDVVIRVTAAARDLTGRELAAALTTALDRAVAPASAR